MGDLWNVLMLKRVLCTKGKKSWGTMALTQRSDSTGWKFRQGASRWGDFEGTSAAFSQIITHGVTWSTHEQPGCGESSAVDGALHISLRPGLGGVLGTARAVKPMFLDPSCINELQWPDVTILTLFVCSMSMQSQWPPGTLLALGFYDSRLLQVAHQKVRQTPSKRKIVFTNAAFPKERANADLSNESTLSNALHHKDDHSDQPKQYGEHGTTSSLPWNHYSPDDETIMVIITACSFANSILCGLDHFFS